MSVWPPIAGAKSEPGSKPIVGQVELTPDGLSGRTLAPLSLAVENAEAAEESTTDAASDKDGDGLTYAQEMRLGVGIAYDAELLAEVGRRFGGQLQLTLV